MEIRNAIIITDAGSQLRMSVDEQANFTGNIVFSHDKLPSHVVADLERAVGKSVNHDPVPSEKARAPVKSEFVG